jgi:hypothetical protein
MKEKRRGKRERIRTRKIKRKAKEANIKGKLN